MLSQKVEWKSCDVDTEHRSQTDTQIKWRHRSDQLVSLLVTY